MADPKLSVYFAGGREIIFDTSANDTDFTIGKKPDGSYTINITVTVAAATANKVIGDLEDLEIPVGGTFQDLRNLLYLENAYEQQVAGTPKKPAHLEPETGSLTLSVFPEGMGVAAPFKMLFDLRFSGGGKTDHGGIDSKTDHGGMKTGGK